MENKPLSKKSIIWLSIVGVLFLFIMLSSFSGSGSVSPTTTDNHVYAGQQGFLRTNVGSTTIVAVSKDAYDRLFKTLSSGDSVGYAELSQAHLIFDVPNGTKVLVIDSSWGDTQVRFLEGQYVGKTAWVSYENVRKN